MNGAPSIRTSGGAPASDTRSRILDAASACFDRASIRRTSIEEIALVSGLSRQTIYRHFQNKEELVAAVSEIKSRMITEVVKARVAKERTSRAKVVTAILVCVECLVGDQLMREMIEIDYRSLMLRSARPGVVAAVTERWAPILRPAIEDGTLRQDISIPLFISWLTDIQLLVTMRIIAFDETFEDVRREVEMFVMDGICRR
jgi:AcrR family transcriptional regulator